MGIKRKTKDKTDKKEENTTSEEDQNTTASTEQHSEKSLILKSGIQGQENQLLVKKQLFVLPAQG